MNAAVLHTLGTPPRCEQFPEPVAGDGEVIVHVHAASLKPVDKQLASGSHYASARGFPVICGTDGVGHLSDGQRVFFGGSRAPYGAMAQSTVAPKELASQQTQTRGTLDVKTDNRKPATDNFKPSPSAPAPKPASACPIAPLA